MKYRYQILDSENVYRGFLKLNRYRLQHELYLGGEGMLATADGYADFARMLLRRGELNGYRFLDESTVAEMMARYDGAPQDGRARCLERIHVTGGTNGILIDALRRHRPFTPTFIGRAEDQAYLLTFTLHYR